LIIKPKHTQTMKYIQQIEHIQNRFALETEMSHSGWCKKLCFTHPELLIITEDEDWTITDYKNLFSAVKNGEVLFNYGGGTHWATIIKDKFILNLFKYSA